MPQEPKKRHSRQRQGKRRASIHLGTPQGTICSNCGTVGAPHAICKVCGYYRGKAMLHIKPKSKTTEKGKQHENTPGSAA